MPEAVAASLIDIGVVKGHLRIEDDFTDDDSYIESLMSVAILDFEEFTGRTLFGEGTDISDESSRGLSH